MCELIDGMAFENNKWIPSTSIYGISIVVNIWLIYGYVWILFAKDNGLGGAFDYDVEVEVGRLPEATLVHWSLIERRAAYIHTFNTTYLLL